VKLLINGGGGEI